MCMSIFLPVILYTTHVPGIHSREVREDVGSPGTEVKGGCQSLCGCWDPNSGSLQEQQVFLTAEPSSQPLCPIFLKWPLIPML